MSPGGSAMAGLLVLVGLTGVGKSTAVHAVLAAAPDARLLPNRRELADRLVIPEAQRAAGEPETPVRDRVERFRLTARYRADHPGGLAHALARYLHDEAGAATPGLWLFDNLRGEDEVGYAAETFADARFVALEAPVATRILRLAGRSDAFDRVADAPKAHAALVERLAAVPGLAGLTDLDGLAGAAGGLDADAVVMGARVVAEESLHYDPDAAWARLEPLPPRRRLRLDTGRLRPAEVAVVLLDWL